MKPDDLPVATSSSQTVPGLAEAALPHDHALDVAVVGRRILAILFDGAIFFVIIPVVFTQLGLPETLDSFVLVLGFLVYKIGTEAHWGKTLGKRLLGISVADRFGRPIGWVPSIVRNLMLIPGAFLLFIPSLVIMEFSPSNQRLGDQMAGTIVVRARHATPATNHVDPTIGPSDVPILQADGPVVVPQPWGLPETWRWLVAGSVALAVTTLIATMILTIDLRICGQIVVRNCEGDVDAPIWAGTRSAHGLAVVSATLALIVMPFCFGLVIKKWVWTLVSACVCGATFMVSVILGYWTVDSFYAEYLSELTDEAGAGIAYFTLLIVGTPVPAFFALLGILAGMGVDKVRTRDVTRPIEA